ncbi:hypothetical protein JDV02_005870 [Purpureocillium takamizusanense]|uniref:C2H2-type domain-containing protein n=1 Tax=Purpureocillium takamizusanense TaxID=2060973 RepID=A0A9Q8VAS4_9HYPO|nr:uncharacterized protein JDV02_005870 [Purpureocillium takamizusanense]UNI19700.1 hypothetical protein JDV02_005870 [Purpureocillium takamizusanense]
MMTAARHQQHPPQLPVLSATDTFDPDEVVPRDSPLMQALRPKLELSPSPPPDIPPAQVSLSPPPIDDFFTSNRSKIRPDSGVAVLVSYLDNGRRPELARVAGAQALPDAEEDVGDDLLRRHSSPGPVESPRTRDIASGARPGMMGPTLQHMAADALQVVSKEPRCPPAPRETLDISASTRHLSISDDRPKNVAAYASSREQQRPPVRLNTEARSPPAMLTPASGELPPLQMDSPRSESNGQSLPSIRSTLGDIKHIPSEPPTPADNEISGLHSAGASFARSPPMSRPRLPLMATSHASPPISPNEVYQRSLPSPHSLPASSPYYYQANGVSHRPSVEYSTSGTGETPSTDHSASTPATVASVVDRMSIDGITNPPLGIFVCSFAGCNAPPFQTQYLLNSHANVHSSARPHYCPVKGCSRSEGGKGFKRKNEMIRHGLVHESPGYVCPFCPDREHKYPRPDNLQRHVRVHHVDKDKDDPLLREVLAQRPDGPNRGRRRRGVPA